MVNEKERGKERRKKGCQEEGYRENKSTKQETGSIREEGECFPDGEEEKR